MELRVAGRALHLTPLAALIASCGLLASCANDSGGGADLPTHTPSPSPVLSEDQEEDALGVAQAFVQAAGDRNHVLMWALLAPEFQEQWTAPEQFAAFIERKFGPAKIELDLGRLEPLQDGRAVEFPLSLEGEGETTPLVGPPLILTRDGESWAVLDAGPLGRQGPIIGTPAPLRPEIEVPILTYHHVAPQLPGDGKDADTVTTAALTGQLEWLADKGQNSISVTELFNAFYYDLPLPPRPIILVFDDGYADFYQHAYPILREHGVQASVSAISGFMDGEGYLTWDQARAMSRDGIEFLSHTVTHVNLAALPAEDALREIGESRRVLEKQLVRPVQFFVYPYGQPFVDSDDAIRAATVALLQEAGYRGALTTSSGPPYIAAQHAGSPYQLRRIPVSGGELLERFAGSIEPTPTPEPIPAPSP